MKRLRFMVLVVALALAGEAVMPKKVAETGELADAEKQTHLTKIEQINSGSFYTPTKLVDIAYGLIEKQIGTVGCFTLIDTSCGYGSFLMRHGFRRRIGADIDPVAVEEARRRVSGVEVRQTDALA